MRRIVSSFTVLALCFSSFAQESVESKTRYYRHEVSANVGIGFCQEIDGIHSVNKWKNVLLCLSDMVMLTLLPLLVYVWDCAICILSISILVLVASSHILQAVSSMTTIQRKREWKFRPMFSELRIENTIIRHLSEPSLLV